MPTSLEQLDLLLLTVAKTCRVQQDGIHFQSHRYMDINLAAFVKEEVLIRYDPADLGEIHVFYQDRFLCRAICAELSDRKVSLKEIETETFIEAFQLAKSRKKGTAHEPDLAPASPGRLPGGFR